VHEATPHADRVTGAASIVQTQPRHQAVLRMFGTLKVKDVVEIEVDVRLPAGR
jgi:ribosomal protein L30/L7E